MLCVSTGDQPPRLDIKAESRSAPIYNFILKWRSSDKDSRAVSGTSQTVNVPEGDGNLFFKHFPFFLDFSFDRYDGILPFGYFALSHFMKLFILIRLQFDLL